MTIDNSKAWKVTFYITTLINQFVSQKKCTGCNLHLKRVLVFGWFLFFFSRARQPSGHQMVLN